MKLKLKAVSALFSLILAPMVLGQIPAVPQDIRNEVNEIIVQLNSTLSELNTEINQLMSHDLNISNFQWQGNADAGCIIPGILHGCTCRASAEIDVNINRVTVGSFDLTGFSLPDVAYDHSGYITMNFTSGLSMNGAAISGGLEAHVSACGIHPHSGGTCSMDAQASGSISISATLGYDDNGCVTITVSSLHVAIPQLQLSNIHADIDLSGLHLDLSGIISALQSITGPLTNAITPLLDTAIDRVLPGMINHVIAAKLTSQCIPFPGHSPSPHTPQCIAAQGGTTSAKCLTSPVPAVGYCAGCTFVASEHGVTLALTTYATVKLCDNNSLASSSIQTQGQATYQGQTYTFNTFRPIVDSEVTIPIIPIPPAVPILTIGVKVSIERDGDDISVAESVVFDETVASQSIPITTQTISPKKIGSNVFEVCTESPQPPPQPGSDAASKKSNLAAIIGGTIGGFILLGAAAGVVFWLHQQGHLQNMMSASNAKKYSVQENNGVPSLQNPSCNIDVVPAVPEYSSNTNARADIYE